MQNQGSCSCPGRASHTACYGLGISRSFNTRLAKNLRKNILKGFVSVQESGSRTQDQEDPKRSVEVHVGFSTKSYIFGIFQVGVVLATKWGWRELVETTCVGTNAALPRSLYLAQKKAEDGDRYYLSRLSSYHQPLPTRHSQLNH